MKLSKSTIGIIAAVVIICIWAASAYNSMVSEQEKATTALANVQPISVVPTSSPIW